MNAVAPVAPQEWAPAEKKPSSFVPQLIGAIKSEDIESMCAYIEKGANLRNGIITSLCQSKNNCLRVLIERAESIDVSCFNWWVINFYNFSDPFYLGEDAEHFELLQALMDKCGPMTYCKDAMVQLARLVSRPAGAYEQLWKIISIALSKQLVNMSMDSDRATGLAAEQMSMMVLLGTQDKVEGTSAFLEKRSPDFKGE